MYFSHLKMYFTLKMYLRVVIQMQDNKFGVIIYLPLNVFYEYELILSY